MTIDELIERLEDYRDELGGQEINERDDGDDEDVDDDRVVFIVEGQQLGYGSKLAWEVAY
jgi:hypothetical protein